MRVQSLELTQFRNYETGTVAFSPRQNIVLGQNGQGKTNLLEALYLLSHARSHRTASDSELVRHAQAMGHAQAVGQTQPFARIQAHLTRHHDSADRVLAVEAQVRLQEGRTKTVFKVNGQSLRSRSELLGHLPTVSFFLPDLLLLRGSPEDRRRWLDAAIVQYDRRHLAYLSEFNQIRQQKNRLLKEAPERISTDHLMTWNIQFAAAGARLIESRLQYLAMIENWTALAYQDLCDRQEHLTLRYHSGIGDGRDGFLPWSDSRSDRMDWLETALSQQLSVRMRDEIRRGTSLVGPHRDDVRFFLDGMSAEAYGSQGQQRSIVLALKLTELQCLSARLHEPPVLLLDDVMAELDPQRQRLLVEHIHPDSQVFLTTTHPAGTWQQLLNRDAHEVAVFEVSGGTVQPASASSVATGVMVR